MFDLAVGVSTPLVNCGCFYVMVVGYVVCMFDVLFWLLGLLVCVADCVLVVDFVQLRWVRLVDRFTSWVSGVWLVAEVPVVFGVGLRVVAVVNCISVCLLVVLCVVVDCVLGLLICFVSVAHR